MQSIQPRARRNHGLKNPTNYKIWPQQQFRYIQNVDNDSLHWSPSHCSFKNPLRTCSCCRALSFDNPLGWIHLLNRTDLLLSLLPCWLPCALWIHLKDLKLNQTIHLSLSLNDKETSPYCPVQLRLSFSRTKRKSVLGEGINFGTLYSGVCRRANSLP